MQSFLVMLQAKLDEAKSKRNINQDIKSLQKQVDTLKIHAELDPVNADEVGRQMGQQCGQAMEAEVNQTAESATAASSKLGNAIKDQFIQARDSVLKFISAESVVASIFDKTKASISELKNVNTYLTEISKSNDALSKSALTKMGSDSFDIAKKYGKTATDYLSGVQEALKAGYENAADIAELSIAAQNAGDMTAELANQMIFATDKAYEMNGSISELTEMLDGVNSISGQNAVQMTELSEGMSIVGSTAASFGVDVNEAAAALGTMIAVTQQSGSEAASAFKTILLNIRQVSDEEGINAEGLVKYEQACNALGVKLKETKNGILSLRDPMEVLAELSAEYNKLEKSDSKRTNLLSSVGGTQNAEQLDALLSQWDTYQTMLQQYEKGTGSMAMDGEKIANSWEGSMNRLSNTWTATVGNIANSDSIITAINSLNNFLSVIDNLTGHIGSLGTIGLGAGLSASLKNVGKDPMYSFNPFCFE